MGMEDLSIDITYDPCQFSLDSTFKSYGKKKKYYLKRTFRKKNYGHLVNVFIVYKTVSFLYFTAGGSEVRGVYWEMCESAPGTRSKSKLEGEGPDIFCIPDYLHSTL